MMTFTVNPTRRLNGVLEIRCLNCTGWTPTKYSLFLNENEEYTVIQGFYCLPCVIKDAGLLAAGQEQHAVRRTSNGVQ